jgi:large subunit ribosomal protein L9
MLLQQVEHLGDPGDVVRVKKGFARNYLLPRRLAAPVGPDAVRQAESAKKRIVSERAQRETEARVHAEALSAASVHVEAKAGEQGTLYGSVTAAMIAEALGRDGFVVDAHNVLLESPIKELGIYDVAIKVHGDVTATVKLYVVAPAPTADA